MNIDMARLEVLLQRSSQGVVTIGVLSLVIVLIMLIHRRSRLSTGAVPHICHAAAAVIGLILGVYAVIGGVGHSVAVASLALDEPAYGSLQVLRFTTGTMLLYTGVMNMVLYRAIRVGRRWAIGVGVAANLLLWLHLLFALPLPGTGGTVPFPLGAWSVCLAWLGAAAFVSKGDKAVSTELPRVQPAEA